MPSKEENFSENAVVWVDSSPHLQYKYRSELIRAATSRDKFREVYRALPPEVRTALGTDSSGEAEFLREKGIAVIPLWDERYPERLNALANPPLVLYARGNLDLLYGRTIAVVGSRKTPKDMLARTRETAAELATRFAIVTGIAEGADKAAIEGSLPAGRTICVLPLGFGAAESGPDRGTVERIAERGLVLTENRYRAEYDKGVYHRRNRIIAGLGEAVLVTGAGEKSGALITVSCALDLGKEVFAFPYNPGVYAGAGCNAIIRDGAGLATSARDIFDAFGMRDYTEADPLAGLSETALALLNALRVRGTATAEVLAADAKVPLAEALPEFAMLELHHAVARMSGNAFRAIK